MSLAVVGGITAGLGLLGGLFQKKPKDIVVKLPGPSPIEEEIAGYQLQIARQLKEQVDDPTIAQDIYKLLPEQNMGKEDIDKFTADYADITKQVYTTALNQAGQMFGKNIQEEGERLGLAQGQINQQKAQNEAAVNAVANMIGKQVEAGRIGHARDYWMRKQGQNAESASLMASIDQAAKDALSGGINSALGYYSKRSGMSVGLQSRTSMANMENAMEVGGARTNLFANTLMGTGSAITESIARNKQNELLREEMAKSRAGSDRLADLMELWREKA